MSATFVSDSSFAPSRRSDGRHAEAHPVRLSSPRTAPRPASMPFSDTLTWWSTALPDSDAPCRKTSRAAPGREAAFTPGEREALRPRRPRGERVPQPQVRRVQQPRLVEAVDLERGLPRGGGRERRRPRARPTTSGIWTPPVARTQLPGRLGREVGRGGRRVGVEVQHAAWAEEITRRLDVEALRLALPLEPQLRRRKATASRREELVEGNRVEPPARGVEARQELPGDRQLRSLPPPDAAPAALARLAAGEQQPHQHALREHDLLAPRVVAQRRQLHDRALRLPLEDAGQETCEIVRHVQRPELRQRPTTRAHRPVPRHLHLRLAERRRDEAREGRLLESPHSPELYAPADDCVHERPAVGQRRGLRVLREVEAWNEEAHPVRPLAERVEASRPELERRLSRVARDDAERHRIWIAMAGAGERCSRRGPGRGVVGGHHPVRARGRGRGLLLSGVVVLLLALGDRSRGDRAVGRHSRSGIHVLETVVSSACRS